MSTSPSNNDDPTAYETQHVHSVYDSIAPHFSQTRYKPWPLISRFLCSLPAGSVGLDIGCGNGKYLGVNPEVCVLGSDRSVELVRIAREQRCRRLGNGRGATTQGVGGEVAVAEVEVGRVSTGSDVLVGDILSLPHRLHGFDFAICIAVVHHLSTRERRIQGIRCVLETLKMGGKRHQQDCNEEDGTAVTGDGGKALIYVWALEQKGSRRGWDTGHEQDVMVPWVMKQKKQQPKQKQRSNNADGDANADDDMERPNETTYERYYHLYKQGELEEDIQHAGGMVLDSGYEKDNWWAIAAPVLESKSAQEEFG